jgi:hypothetical protein
MDSCRDLLARALVLAEDVLREHYGPEAVADRLLVVQTATVAADILLRLGEARLVAAVRGVRN